MLTGLPIVLTVWVAWMIVAKKLSPAGQNFGSVAAIALAWAAFGLVRIDGVDSNLWADVHWRWQASAEEQFLRENRRSGPAVEQPSPSPASGPVTLQPGDVCQFRGGNRDGAVYGGAVHGDAIATDWAKTPPRLLWKQRLGPAWSSVIVAAGRLYTQEQRGEMESVVCYDALTGREVWVHNDQDRFSESVSGAGPRATPTLDDGRIYSVGGNGIVNCLDAATGQRRWSRDLKTDAGCARRSGVSPGRR